MRPLTIFGVSFLLVFSVLVINYGMPKNNSFASGFQYGNEHYPLINVTKFMSIAENGTEFKDEVEGYDHYSLATLMPKLYLQNASNATLEYNLVYDLYKNPREYCAYDKVLVVTLNAHLTVIGTNDYSPYGVPAGYPLPAFTCLMEPANYVPPKVDYNRLIRIIPWVPPLEQLNYGVPAIDVSCINGLVLVLKEEDGSPACVWPNTAQKLIKRGWTKEIVSELIQ